MPFADTVSSISGRNSRASNVSRGTGTSRSLRSPPATNNSDTLANAGVLSMLKTSTDTGDIGALSFNSSRLPGVPARAQQRRQHASKPSYQNTASASHRYAPSATSRVSSARDWDSASNGRQGSLTSMQTMPTHIPEPPAAFVRGLPPSQIPVPKARDSRSYSMTNPQLPRLKSEHSLKSQGHASAAPGGQENRPAFAYPTRLKRPGYRSPSPALSDSHAQIPPVPLIPHSAMRQPLHAASPRTGIPHYMPQHNTQVVYEPDPTVPHARPVSPGAYVPSPMIYSSPTSQYGYTSASISPPPHMPSHHPRMPMHEMPPQYTRPHEMPGTYGPPRPRPVEPMQQQHAYQHRPAHAGPTHAYMAAQPGRRGFVPQQNAVPMAHQIFHNAARMARHLPQRTDTPLTDVGPSSSEPPSSGGTAPSSSPPTPQDWTAMQIGVNPAFIDPALTDLPESTSDPVIPARYFDYVDGLKSTIDDSQVEVHNSVPPSGFVQRVREMLESKAAAEGLVHKYDQEESVAVRHEAFANGLHRVTVIEEFQAPAELPASPVKIAELEAPIAKSPNRLTRELVKAELALSDTEEETSLALKPTFLPIDETLTVDESTVPRHVVSPFEEDSEQTTNMPSSPPIQHDRQLSSTDTARSSAAESSRILTEDFAFRFSVPAEDTVGLGETDTDTKDRFVLDADTITAQNQIMKESVTPHHPTQYTHEPVSALSAGDIVRRFSAVSPLHSRVHNVEEKSFAPDETELMERIAEDETHPPPTPRTPRGHSKSVNLQPNTMTETTNHRLSLPADFTQYTNTTTGDTTTEAMTDFAVRFSIPQGTVMLAKPQIVHVSSSSPASKEEPPQKVMLTDKKPKRGPVTFEQDLVENKDLVKVHRPSKSSGSINNHVSNRLSAIHHATPEYATDESTSTFYDDTLAGRMPMGIVMRNKYLGPHLSDLKEESLEDVSLRDPRRSMEVTNAMQFQLPARIAAVKAMQERKQQELEAKKNGLRHEQAGRPLTDLRDLPSLNFSRTDLIDQLNDALVKRPTKSMDILRRRDLSPIYCPSPQRPQSTEPLRERYMSFFERPEDFPDDLDESQLTEETIGRQSSNHESTDSDQDPDRPLSPEEHLLSVATEVNRLSIPSVAGLSARLSELIPSLRNLHFGNLLASDRDIAQTLDDIHNLGPNRPDTVMTNRTSAGFRTLAERAEEFVKNGTHESVMYNSKTLRLNKELPPLPICDADRKSPLPGSISAPSDLCNAPTRPCSALIKYRPPTSQEEVHQMLPPEMNPISRLSKRSMVLSGVSSRPWNLDENYP